MKLDNLRLDRPTLDDVDKLYAIYSDPRVWTHLPRGRHTERSTTAIMVRAWIQGWERDGLAAWMVRETDTGALIGHAGCSVNHHTYWNLGYRFGHDYHGRGYATRVSTAAVEAAQRTDPAMPVVAYMLEHNAASARVAEKVGLTLQHRGPDAGNPDPDAIRLVYADRALTPEQLEATLR